MAPPAEAWNDGTLFGGVVYLFLRGITGSPDGGVHFDPVPIALIEALEAGLNS